MCLHKQSKLPLQGNDIAAISKSQLTCDLFQSCAAKSNHFNYSRNVWLAIISITNVILSTLVLTTKAISWVFLYEDSLNIFTDYLKTSLKAKVCSKI